MGEVIRYAIIVHHNNHVFKDMQESSDGDYVRYADFTALQEENKRLKAAQQQMAVTEERIDRAQAEREAVDISRLSREAMEKGRRAGMLEAAKLLCFGCSCGVPKNILSNPVYHVDTVESFPCKASVIHRALAHPAPATKATEEKP